MQLNIFNASKCWYGLVCVFCFLTLSTCRKFTSSLGESLIFYFPSAMLFLYIIKRIQENSQCCTEILCSYFTHSQY